jgi:membrane-associated phospholipid phosphatase
LTNNPPTRVSLFLFCLAVVEVAGFPFLLPFDSALHDWIVTQRSCALDASVGTLRHWPLSALFVCGGLTLVALGRQGRRPEVFHAVTVIASGALLCELLKTGLERPRPSALPSLLVGNSFPSGHVTTAVLIAGVTGLYLWRDRAAWWLKGVSGAGLAALVGLVIGQRVYFAHHWLSDLIGSLLLSGAWLSFALPEPSPLRKPQALGLLGVGLLMSYGAFYAAPGIRMSLPSALTFVEEPLLAFSFGEPDTQALLSGAWGGPSREPIGHITWMHQGEASLRFLLPKSQPYTLRLAVRPFFQTEQAVCFPLEVSVNRWPVSQLFLYRGWREYALRLDPAWVTPGVNILTFRPGVHFPAATADSRAVAFRQLSFFAEKQ